MDGKDEIGDLARTFNLMCDRLEMEERARRSLLADVAHELRHPLAVLQGRLELMQDGKVELDQAALLPQDEVIRLTRLVGDLRDLSLAEVGGLSLRRTELDLKALLEGLLTNMEPVAAAKAIDLLAEVPAALPVIVADGDRIRQGPHRAGVGQPAGQCHSVHTPGRPGLGGVRARPGGMLFSPPPGFGVVGIDTRGVFLGDRAAIGVSSVWHQNG